PDCSPIDSSRASTMLTATPSAPPPGMSNDASGVFCASPFQENHPAQPAGYPTELAQQARAGGGPGRDQPGAGAFLLRSGARALGLRQVHAGQARLGPA